MVVKGLPWILLANVVISIDYSMIMPTGFKYIMEMGGDWVLYGATIAAFPIGRICLLLLFGYWSDKKGFKAPFQVANLLGICGGLIYGAASAVGVKELALVGRFIAGAGATHPLSAWAARVYEPELRVEIETKQKAAQLIGVVVGPAMNAMFVNLDVEIGFLRLNPETMAGYFPAFLNFVLLVGFLYGVQEPPSSDFASADDDQPFRHLWETGAWICMFIAFYTNLQIAAVDTLIAPLTQRYWKFGLLANSGLFAGLAVLSFAGVVVGIVSKRKGIATIKIMIAAALVNFVFSTMQSVSLWNAPENIEMSIFTLSGIFIILSVLVYSGPTGGLYQQACGNAQGLLGGLYTMSFALGRPVGSMLGGNLLDGNPLGLCIVLPLCVGVSLFLQLQYWNKLETIEREALLGRPPDIGSGFARRPSLSSSGASFIC